MKRSRFNAFGKSADHFDCVQPGKAFLCRHTDTDGKSFFSKSILHGICLR